jgi:hypothetical protein
MVRVITTGETHGKVGTPEYNSWRGMVERCESQNHPSYLRYGARGISVCPRWRASFSAFLADMGTRPPKTTLERIDNSKGYEPGNCCWADRKTQARNKRNNRLLTARGETKTLAEWSEVTGLNFATILTRIDRDGWEVEKALFTPAGTSRKNTRWLTLGDRTQSITDWARELKTSRAAISDRLHRGMSVEDALTTPFNLDQRFLTHAGETLSLTGWSKKLGWPIYVIQNRLRKGWTVERALTTPPRACRRS